MNYFTGIEWRLYNHLPQCTAWIDRKFDYYALNYAHAGRILWGMDASELITLNAPVTWWTGPGARFTYGSAPGESWDHYFVAFSGPRIKQWLKGELWPAIPDYRPYSSVDQPDAFRTLFEALLATLDTGSRSHAYAVHQLEGLLLHIHAQAGEDAPATPLETQIRVLLEQIRQHPQGNWDGIQEAQRLCVSYVHLRRLVRRLAGLPFHQYVLKSRLDLAAHLLRTTSDPIKTIVAQVALSDIHYFSKLFKRQYGVAPATYRKESQLL